MKASQLVKQLAKMIFYSETNTARQWLSTHWYFYCGDGAFKLFFFRLSFFPYFFVFIHIFRFLGTFSFPLLFSQQLILSYYVCGRDILGENAKMCNNRGFVGTSSLSNNKGLDSEKTIFRAHDVLKTALWCSKITKTRKTND